MKSLLSLLALCMFTMNAAAQIEVSVEMGSKTYTFTGHQIFNGNSDESTYYLIEDKTLHYYYVNNYQGKVIQYSHTECPLKSLDLKTVEYKDYDDGGKFMYLKTKKLVKDVKITKVDDGEVAGDSLDANITIEEDEKHNFMLIINSAEMGADLEAKMKKG